MSVTVEHKAQVFADELNLIYDETIREFTKFCIIAAPDYFFVDCPASSTGKHHPLNELGWDGTIIHTKKVVKVAYALCRGLGCENNRDLILSACIIHDLRKQGLNKSGFTNKRHPDFGASLVTEVQEATNYLDKASYSIIRCCVGYHYGPWSIRPWVKSLGEYTPEEMCVYMSDYIASKRELEIPL